MYYQRETGCRSIQLQILALNVLPEFVPAQCICDLLSISVPEVESAQCLFSKVAQYVSFRDVSVMLWSRHTEQTYTTTLFVTVTDVRLLRCLTWVSS